MQESGLTAEQTRLLNEMMTGLTAEQRRLLHEMLNEVQMRLQPGLTAEQMRRVSPRRASMVPPRPRRAFHRQIAATNTLSKHHYGKVAF